MALELILKINVVVPSVEGSSLASRQSIAVTVECAWWAPEAPGGEAGKTKWWVEISKGLCRAGTCSGRQLAVVCGTNLKERLEGRKPIIWIF